MAKVGRAVGIAGLAMGAGIVFGLKKSIDSANEHAVALALTEAGIKSTGGAAKVTAQHITGLADSIEKKTGVDDLAVQAGQNMLLTFTKIRNEVGAGNKIFDRATLAVTDLSVRLGKDAPASALMLGKALNDPIKGVTALGRAGVQFTAEQKTAIAAMVETGNVLGAQKAILKEVETQVGGSAKAFGQTLPGQLNILKGHLDDVGQRIGQKLVPALTSAVQWVTAHWPEISAVMEKVMTEVGSAIGSAVGTIRKHWDTIARTGKAAFDKVKGIASGLGNFISHPIGSQVALAVGSMAVFVLAAEKAGKAYMAMKLLFTAGAFSSPFGLVVGGIGLLAGLVASQLIPSMMDGRRGLDTLGDGAKLAADQINGLKDALRGLNDKQAEARNSNTAYQGAMLTLHTVLAEGVVIRQKYKQGSQEVITQEQREKEAADGVKDALERKKRAQEDLIGQTKKVKQAVGDTTSELFKTAGAYAKVANQQSQGEVFAKSFRAETDKFSATLTGARNKHLEMAQAVASTNPTLAANQRQIAINDQTILTLTRSLGRIPKKTEIIAALKDPQSIRKATSELDKLPAAASKAGTGATSGLQKGMAPMGERANAATRKVPEIVRGFSGATRSGGFATGSAGGQGVAEGIMSQIPAIRSAAAQAAAASVIKMQQVLRTGSRSKETYEKAGIPAGQGLIEGITDYLKANGTKVAEAAKKAVDIAAQVLPSIQAAGRIIGLGKARAIAMGILQGSPGIVAQIRQAMNDAKKAAREAALALVKETKDVLSSGFSDLASAAFAAFDAKASQFKSKARKALEEMQLKDTKKGLAGAITRSAEELEKAKAAAGVSGLSPEDQDAANKAVLAAQQALDDAKKAQWMFQKEQQAQREEAAHVKKMERDRQRFANELAQAQTWINKHPKLVEEGQKRIREVLTKFLGDFRLSGAAVGYAVAQGLEDSLDAVGKAARKVAAEIAKYLKLKSPAERGPLSDLHTWASGFATTYLKSLDTDAISKAIGNVGGMPAMAGAGAGSARLGMDGPMAGGGSQIIRLETRINLDGKEIAYNTRDHLVRGGQRNDGGMLPGA